MFAATINPSELETALKPVNSLVDRCKVHIDGSGISVTAVDPANVGMVDLHLPPDVFTSYEAQRHTIGVALDRFIDILSLFAKEDGSPLARIMLEEETRQLRLECNSLNYTLSLIDPDTLRDEPDIPQLDLATEIEVPGRTFKRAIDACDMVSEYLHLGATNDDEFYVRAKGDTDSVEVTMDNGDLIEFAGEGCDSLFSVDYLCDMETPIPPNAPVTVGVGNDFPVLINFNLVDGDAEIQYVLAPRINSE